MLSIIIPCYNCEKTISRCLDSILSQTYTDFEVLAIDDGSNDNTYKYLKMYENKDNRIRPISKENGGPSSARNLGLSLAKGDYIGFVDSDDYISNNMYELLIKKVVECDAQIAICNYSVVNENGEQTNIKHVLSPYYSSHKEIVNGIIRQYYDGDPTGLAGPCNKLYNKKFISSSQITFDDKLYRAEDWWFNLKLYEKAERIVTLQESLYFYWQGNPDSLMKKMNADYYSQWKTARLYLEEKNKIYKFNYDKNIFYKELLLNIHSLLISLSKNNQDISFIIKDPFYKKIISFDKYTSICVKICHFSSKLNIKLTKYTYAFLAKIYKLLNY